MEYFGLIFVGLLTLPFIIAVFCHLVSVIKDSSPKSQELQSQLELKIKETDELKQSYLDKEHDLNERKQALENEIDELHQIRDDTTSRLSDLFGKMTIQSISDQIPSTSFVRALEGNFSLKSPISVTCQIHSAESNRSYSTSLSSCTCESFTFGHKPCKHMIWLAARFGLLLTTKEQQDACLQRIEEENKKINDAQTYLIQAEKLQKRLNDKAKIIEEQSLTYPWLSRLLMSYDDKVDELRQKRLEERAKKSAEIVRQIRFEKRIIQEERNLLRNQLTVYESLFPWLEEFKEVSVSDAADLVSQVVSDSDYTTATKKWLSPQEYLSLTSSEKAELALSRYQSRHKSDWEIGVEYERYIGYLYEKQGYSVKYTGATMGLSDMGRDLLAEKDGKVLVIQCKRWSSEKTIHEKHIFQLFGTSYILRLTNPSLEYTPVFYTTTSLSETASLCASGLGITVYEQYQFDNYPVIKCNIGHDKDGTPVKIYHLPFDQQYDRIVVEPSKGEFYATTIQEAEAAGFRHAYKWMGT